MTGVSWPTSTTSCLTTFDEDQTVGIHGTNNKEQIEEGQPVTEAKRGGSTDAEPEEDVQLVYP